MNSKPVTAGIDRRSFLKSTVALVGGASFAPSLMRATTISGDNNINILGVREGYSPNICLLVSIMNWMRHSVLEAVKGLTTEQLDFLLDEKANTIGALLYHLAATDAFYHEN